MSEVGFFGLGFAVLLHIIFVSITIGVGWIAAYSRLKAYLSNDSYLEMFSRKVFKVMVVFELFSGVWGTIITVFLAGFFPTLTALATNVLFVPLLIALISIMVRIPSIGIFWYTWGKIHPKYHSFIGIVMAVSGFTIPLGFRAIFSEITAPTAVAEYLSTSAVSPLAAYANPFFWLLYLHTLFAVMSVGGFVVAYLMSLEGDSDGIRVGYLYGLGFLLIQIPMGVIFWASLHDYSPYMFSSVTFGSFAPAFAAKIAVVTALLVLGVLGYVRESASYTKYSLILALSAVFFGEMMNSGARYPYMVVTGSEGIPIAAFSNFYIEVPMVAVYVIMAFLLISLAVFLTAAFYALFKRYLTEVPES
ncbi:cytochrome ubiquinol oxidase subunit I [Archaeoglobus sp.]|uniref:cytochrome ubiquinol oxidase subunit I n=1 Tax=Archaeoglobus sp. TaxID=1872626 RepID=UPI0024ABF12B|nr:cytochrome ubiquinol oxidase subunit I [Archaeoglobus sp.]MDI3497007.1 cytochrome bd ubiquinol oxidase subunit [Archaeoglobus sp.]